MNRAANLAVTIKTLKAELRRYAMGYWAFSDKSFGREVRSYLRVLMDMEGTYSYQKNVLDKAKNKKRRKK